MSPEHPLTFRSAVNGWNFHLALTVVWRVKMFPLFHQTLFKCLQLETRVGREISSLTFNLSETENCFCNGCTFFFRPPPGPLNRSSIQGCREVWGAHNALNIPVCQPEQCGGESSLWSAPGRGGNQFPFKTIYFRARVLTQLGIPSKKTNRGLLSSECSLRMHEPEHSSL